jgi:hypothetical protein
MRTKALIRIGFYAALFVMLQGAKCPQIPETKDVEITVVTEQYVELAFEARGNNNIDDDSDIAVIDITEIRQDLEDADVDPSAIDTLVVSGVLYGVTANGEEPNTDREIVNGMLTVTRADLDSTATIFDDVDVAVYPLLGKLEPAPIQPDGIAFINDLLADVLAAVKTGAPPTFEVQGHVSGQSLPLERETNFDWRMRIYYQVTGHTEVEMVDF